MGRRKLHRYISAHAMPNDNRLSQRAFGAKPDQITSIAGHSIVLPWRIALAMSAKIDRDHTM